MLNVKEARKLTEDSAMQILGEIETGIRNNASKGKYIYEHLIESDGEITDTIIKSLKNFGFKVEDARKIGFDCNWRTRLTITWEDDTNDSKE